MDYTIHLNVSQYNMNELDILFFYYNVFSSWKVINAY